MQSTVHTACIYLIAFDFVSPALFPALIRDPLMEFWPTNVCFHLLQEKINTLIYRMTEPDKTLGDEAVRLWSPILTREYDFTVSADLVKALRSIKKQVCDCCIALILHFCSGLPCCLRSCVSTYSNSDIFQKPICNAVVCRAFPACHLICRT